MHHKRSKAAAVGLRPWVAELWRIVLGNWLSRKCSSLFAKVWSIQADP